MLIRRPRLDELDRVRELVQAVVDEVYGGVWAQPPLDIGADDWSLGWIACIEDALAGVALTHDDWLDDLWIAGAYRDRGIGAALLAEAEREMYARGHRVARLSVIAVNNSARRFYARHGWIEAREFISEPFEVRKIEMTKLLS